MLTAARATRALLLLLVCSVLWGCAKGKSTVQPFEPADVMYSRAMVLLSKHQLREAINTLQRIDLQLSDEDRQRLQPLVQLALADATFYQWNDLALIDARSMYLDFITLYGDHPHAPYAVFQTGICSLKQVRHPSRDQTQTFRAITDLEEVERRYPNSAYAMAARGAIRQAESNLAEHEFLVGRFYMKRSKWIAAQERFRRVLDVYPDAELIEKVYFHLGRVLLESDNDVEGKIYLDKLVHQFPDGKLAEEARKALGVLDGPIGFSADGAN